MLQYRLLRMFWNVPLATSHVSFHFQKSRPLNLKIQWNLLESFPSSWSKLSQLLSRPTRRMLHLHYTRFICTTHALSFWGLALGLRWFPASEVQVTDPCGLMSLNRVDVLAPKDMFQLWKPALAFCWGWCILFFSGIILILLSTISLAHYSG